MLNTITIQGRICNELELKRTTTGTDVITFGVAVERDYKGQDGNRQTDFFDVTAFDKRATFISQYFEKGRMIIISGRLNTRTWTDNTGAKRKAVEIIAENTYFGDSKTESKAESNPEQLPIVPPSTAPERTTVDEAAYYDDDDLPF